MTVLLPIKAGKLRVIGDAPVMIDYHKLMAKDQMRSPETIRMSMRQDCSYCKVGPGEVCLTRAGRKAGVPHKARRKVAQSRDLAFKIQMHFQAKVIDPKAIAIIAGITP